VKRKADADRLPDGHRTAAEIRRSGPTGQHHKKRRSRTGSATPPFLPGKAQPRAFCAAASACEMGGRARSDGDDRMRPGRMRNAFSSGMARTPHIVPSNSYHRKRNTFAGCAPVARCANSPCNQLKNHNRPLRHLAAFGLAIDRARMQRSAHAEERQSSPNCDLRSCASWSWSGGLIASRTTVVRSGVARRRTRKDPSVAI
jgi:hypothetical protein